MAFGQSKLTGLSALGIVLWCCALALVCVVMIDMCSVNKDNDKDNCDSFTNNNDFDYTENFDINDDNNKMNMSEIGNNLANNAADVDEVANQELNFEAPEFDETEDNDEDKKDKNKKDENSKTVKKSVSGNIDENNFATVQKFSNVDEKSMVKEVDGELLVEGSDALIVTASDRFYHIDTKGQLNRNASNDLRGDLPIPYNESYTPFNQSGIVGDPLVPTGRL